MIELALSIPVVAMIAMIALARLERSLDQAIGEPEPPRAVPRPRAAGTIRVRRSGRLWALNGRGGVADVGEARVVSRARAIGGAGASGVRTSGAVRAVGGPQSGNAAGLVGH